MTGTQLSPASRIVTPAITTPQTQRVIPERSLAGTIASVDTESIDVERGQFDAQVTRPLASSITTVDIGDGIQIVRDPASDTCTCCKGHPRN